MILAPQLPLGFGDLGFQSRSNGALVCTQFTLILDKLFFCAAISSFAGPDRAAYRVYAPVDYLNRGYTTHEVIDCEISESI